MQCLTEEQAKMKIIRHAVEKQRSKWDEICEQMEKANMHHRLGWRTWYGTDKQAEARWKPIILEIDDTASLAIEAGFRAR
jgi:hypothetical protein